MGVQYVQGQSKNLFKFSDTCSVRADGLCIASPRLVGGRMAGNSNMQQFFSTTAYVKLNLAYMQGAYITPAHLLPSPKAFYPFCVIIFMGIRSAAFEGMKEGTMRKGKWGWGYISLGIPH